MDESRLVRKHLLAWAKQLDEPPPASLLPFIDRVLQRAEELVQEQDLKPNKAVTQEAMRKLTREVDSLETKVATCRRTIPQDIKSFFQRSVGNVVEIRSKHEPQTSTVAATALTTAEETEIIETSKRVETLFAAIQEQMPNTLDRAETNLTALKNADFRTEQDSRERSPPPLSPGMESAKLLSQAIATNTRKKIKHQ